MQKRAILTSFIFSVFLIQLASAAISFSEPDAIYSLGDTLDIDITLNPSVNTNGFFTAMLRCDDDGVEIFKMPYSATAAEQETFQVKARLDKNLIDGLEGICYVEARYGIEEGTSSNFEISSLIVVDFDIQENLFEPEQTISFSGTAELKNGNPVNGNAKILISGNSTIENFEVIEGVFSGNITLSNNIAPGNYNLEAIVTQEEDGNVLNSGKASNSFRVKQIVKAVEIALSQVSVKPESEIEYQIILYDQVLGKTVNDVIVKLVSPLGTVIEEKIVSSTITNDFSIERDYEPGEWTIEAEVNGIKSTANFNVETIKNISIEISNTTIFVINTGNVIYDLPLEIKFGDVVEVISLSLKVGEGRTYKLFAPDGDYDLYAKTSENGSISFGKTWLTGRAIEVKDLSDEGNNLLKGLVWTIIVLVLVAGAFIAYRKYSLNRTYSSPNSSVSGPIKPSPPAGSLTWKSSKPEVKEMRKLSEITAASKQASDYGSKEEATVVVMKVKNYDELYKYKGSEPAMNALVQAAGFAKNSKAQVTREGNFTIMIFSQAGTGSKDPHMAAIKTAKEIESLLKSHNRKYSRKISFGLGATTGEMIIERRQGAAAHTSVGTIIPTAKKIAEHAHDELLLSDTTRSKLRGQIKVDKGIGGIYWSVRSTVNRSEHNEFINRFMERRADESKSF